jgi:signal transduction histidine kinase/DNA-binding NarL/FixJ family response regulator
MVADGARVNPASDPPGRGASGRGKWRSLRIRFVVAISALVGVVLLANAAILVLTSRRQIRGDIERRAIAYSRLAVRPICEAYETYYTSGYSKFRELVTDVVELNPDVARLSLYDTTGRLLFSSEEFAVEVFNPEDRRRPKATDRQLVLAVKALEIRAWPLPDGEQAGFRVVAPYVEEWGRHRYSVAFDISYRGLRSAMLTAAVRIGWLTAASLALGVLIAVVLAAQSLGPVEQLTRGAEDLAEGRLDRRIALHTGDEFEVLADAFNHMAGQLAASISELEASNEALQQSNLELKEMDRLKSDLLANVSHELRTPLTAIQGYTEALQEGLLGEVTDAAREALSVIERNIRRLISLINELLSYTRLTSRKFELELRAFDLEATARQVAGTLLDSQGPGVHLSVTADPELPSVWGDPYRISQVVENLLTNALKFTPPGGRVGVRLRRRAERVEVAVTDTGIGIPEKEQPRVFERFYQVESSSTRKFGGIGLGLSIVRQILDAHGCAIHLESTPGEGTTFTFSLPVATGPSLREQPVGRRIALVDDDAAFTRELSELLEEHGCSVRTASSCEGAEQLIREFRPDLVILDRLLPDGDGFDLLSRWRSRPMTAGLPILVTSIRHEEALGMRLGASDYLIKPVPMEEIVAVAQSLLGDSEAGREVWMVGEDEELTALAERLVAEGLQVQRAAAAHELDGDGAISRPAAVVMALGGGTEVGDAAEIEELRRDSSLPVFVVAAPGVALPAGWGEEGRRVQVVERPFDLDGVARRIVETVRAPARRTEA